MIKWIKIAVRKINSYRVKYSVGTAGSPRDLTLKKKKGKFIHRHGETAQGFKVERTIKTTASYGAPVEKVQETAEMWDLQEESVNIRNAGNKNVNKKFNQTLVKPLPCDEVELIKNNQMLTDVFINMAQKILSIHVSG